MGYCYDASGNLLNAGACGTSSYAYDGESRMVAAAGFSYDYDADGRRVKKASGSNGTLYWYGSDGEVLLETDLAGNLQNEYIFFNGQRVARHDLYDYVDFYVGDHLGSTRLDTDVFGNPLDDSDYYPFGGERVVLSNSSNHYKFSGKERDTETGLDYFGARYYGSTIGRFTTPDWSAHPVPVPFGELNDPQTLNLYSYVRNNALSKADPDGHDPGDKFKSKVAAAADAVKYMRKQENGYKWEYGTRIQQIGKSYTYTEVRTDNNPTNVNPPPLQKNDVGDVHTHNYGVGHDAGANKIEQPDRISTVQDKEQVQKMQNDPNTKVNYQSYVGAPNGDLIQFTPNSKAPDLLGDAKVVKKNVAPDPNPPLPEKN